MAEPAPKSALDPPKEILEELGEESDEYEDIEVRPSLAVLLEFMPTVFFSLSQEEGEHEEGGYEDEDEEEEGDKEEGGVGGSVRAMLDGPVYVSSFCF